MQTRAFYIPKNTKKGEAIKGAIKLVLILFLILASIIAVPADSFAYIFSSVAVYHGTITVNNVGTATANVSTNLTIATSTFISNGYASTNMSNTTIQDATNTNVPYMPAISGSAQWCIFASNVPVGASSYTLYSGGATDLNGKIRFFGSLDVPNSATLEPLGATFNITISGWFDTTQVGHYIWSHELGGDPDWPGNFVLYVSATGNITAQQIGEAPGLTLTYPLASGEHTISVTDNSTKRLLYIDDLLVDIKDRANITDTNNWWFNQDAFTTPNYTLAYISYASITIAGIQQGYWYWENAATFTDHSPGGLHPATPTFRTTTSDADVTATLSSFTSINTAQISSYTLGTSGVIFSGNATMPTQMYTENDTSTFPGGAVVNALLDSSGTPRALWWYPFLFILVSIIGLLVYEATTMVAYGGNEQRNLMLQTGGKDGSLLAMCAVIEVCLVIIGLMGATSASSLIPFWPAILFLIPFAMVISSQWWVKTSG